MREKTGTIVPRVMCWTGVVAVWLTIMVDNVVDWYGGLVWWTVLWTGVVADVMARSGGQ